MHAQIAACRTGERGLGELIDRFGLDTVNAAAAEVFDQCERLDREAVAAIPDGVYRTSGEMDSWGPGGDPVYVQVTVAVEGDELVIDLEGSDPQTPGCMNCGFAQTAAAGRLAFKMLVNSDVPVTAGTFRNVTVTAPEASVFDAREPAACQYYYPHLGMMIDLVIRALAPALPGRVVAGQAADPMNVLFSGLDPRSKEPFVVGEATAVGWGAYQGGDGTNGLINYGGGDLKNIPVEVMESRYPVRVHKYALWQDSGGPRPLARRDGNRARIRGAGRPHHRLHLVRADPDARMGAVRRGVGGRSPRSPSPWTARRKTCSRSTSIRPRRAPASMSPPGAEGVTATRRNGTRSWRAAI